MDNFYQQPRPFNPYQTQSYMPPYNGTIISVKGAEGCNASVKRNAVKEAITAWVNWEKETKELYEKKYIELCDTKDVAAALFVKCLIEDVDYELKQAEEKMMKLAAAGYDMIYILDEQEWLKEKYTKKTRVD